jgi:DHA1 family bicyclomycin/chloramphenicol resistance-like MFS transporter
MVALMTTMPQATAGALTPFPEIAGSASSLLAFVQFVVASSAALAVGLTFDGTPRAMATVIAIAAALAFAAFRGLAGRRPPAPDPAALALVVKRRGSGS